MAQSTKVANIKQIYYLALNEKTEVFYEWKMEEFQRKF
jgi:hypothetical protein